VGGRRIGRGWWRRVLQWCGGGGGRSVEKREEERCARKMERQPADDRG
jgi:hypothetical protein